MRLFLVLIVIALVAPGVQAAFIPGDVFTKDFSGRIYNVTAGGDFGGPTQLATVNSADLGHAAFSADLSTMYVSGGSQNNVYAVTSTGAVSVFATGLSRSMGLLRTSTGRLLVAEIDSGEITDITAGGNFTGAAAFAQGLSSPIDLAQTNDGRIFATENGPGEISNITAGGLIGPANVFASGVGGAFSLLATPSGGLMASSLQNSAVYSFSSSGTMSAFGTNALIWGLAYAADGRLLGADLNSGVVRNISAGGNMSAAPFFATGLAANGLVSVPLPEPTSAAFIALGATLLRRRRSRS